MTCRRRGAQMLGWMDASLNVGQWDVIVANVGQHAAAGAEHWPVLPLPSPLLRTARAEKQAQHPRERAASRQSGG
eukprot:594113-Rhodomonas_salina.1